MAGVAREREVRRERARTAKGKGEAGNIGMLGRRQVTPRWADDTVRIQSGRRQRGCWGRRGLPPSEGHRTAGIKGGAVQE